MFLSFILKLERFLREPNSKWATGFWADLWFQLTLRLHWYRVLSPSERCLRTPTQSLPCSACGAGCLVASETLPVYLNWMLPLPLRVCSNDTMLQPASNSNRLSAVCLFTTSKGQSPFSIPLLSFRTAGSHSNSSALVLSSTTDLSKVPLTWALRFTSYSIMVVPSAADK